MIKLKQSKESPIVVSKKFLADYKEQGDKYLANIRRNLSKQPAVWTLYGDLQQLYNAYGDIINSLVNGEYYDISEVRKGFREYEKVAKYFVKMTDGEVPYNIQCSVEEDVEDVRLLLVKLVTIIEKYCNTEG